MKYNVTISLNAKEKKTLDKLCEDHDMNEEQVMRQALKVYQTVDYRIKKGLQIFPRDIPVGCVDVNDE